MLDDDRRRYNILIKRSIEVFDGLENDRSSLSSRNISLIGFNLALLSIISAGVSFGIENGWNLSSVDYALLILIFIFLSISLSINICIFKPGDYKVYKIFGKDRFEELKNMDEPSLLSDTLYQYKTAFEYNKEKYDGRMELFSDSLWLFITANVILISLILKNLLF